MTKTPKNPSSSVLVDVEFCFMKQVKGRGPFSVIGILRKNGCLLPRVSSGRPCFHAPAVVP